MTNMQAALGVAQLARFEQIVERKRAIAHAYSQRLKDVPSISLPVEEPWARSVYWVYGIVLNEDTGTDAAQLGQRLAAKGVDTRPFFLGMHEQPAFHRMGLFHGERYPVAERLARQGLYLPTGLALGEPQIDQVCDAVRTCLA